MRMANPFWKHACCLAIALLFLSVFFSRAHCSQDPAGLYNRARFNEAVRQYRRAANAGDRSGFLNLAVILKDLGHYRQAIRVLNAAAIRFPHDRPILSLLGRIYFLNSEPQPAIRIFQQVLAITPDDADSFLTLGLCYESLGLDTEAGDYLRKALGLDPNNIRAHLSLADIYSRNKRLKESAQEYKTVNLLDASIQQIYRYWGAILFDLNNNLEAYKIYEKIRVFEPENAAVLDRLEVIRARLGKKFFAQEKEKRKAEKAQKKVLVKPGSAEGAALVRVGLVHGASHVELKVSTAYTIKTRQGGILLGTGAAGQACTISAGPDGKIMCQLGDRDRLIADESIVIKPVEARGTCTIFGMSVGKDDFWQTQEDRSYRGDIEAVSAGGKVRIINSLSIEEYLYSVVPSEMLPSWPLEALKAQAVAARSEAMSKRGRHKADGYDFCPDVHCQSYAGVEQETAVTNLAVDETAGRVLYYKGKVVDAIYSSCCGGHTQSNIFSKEAVGYFQGVYDALSDTGRAFPLSPVDLEQWLKDPPVDILCNIPEFARSSNFRWVRVYSASEMDALAGKLGDIGKVAKIIVMKRNPSGHISALKISGSRSSYLLERELNIRKALGNLRSSMFKIEVKYGPDQVPAQFVFYGGGWGHGVGMCQAGACGMANKGKGFADILAHYFTDTVIKKIY
jgi:stage II sporulation protein D